MIIETNILRLVQKWMIGDRIICLLASLSNDQWQIVKLRWLICLE